MSLNESNMSEANKHINHYTTEESIDKKVNLTDLLARLEVEKKKDEGTFTPDYMQQVVDQSTLVDVRISQGPPDLIN